MPSWTLRVLFDRRGYHPETMQSIAGGIPTRSAGTKGMAAPENLPTRAPDAGYNDDIASRALIVIQGSRPMSSRLLSACVALSAAALFSGLAADDPAPKVDAPAKTSTTKKAAAAKDKDAAKEKIKTEVATFGGGCFWCLEAVYERVPGVVNVVSGYSGGTYKKPNYEAVSSGTTGHAEVVQITYDPEKITFEKLLEVFFVCHDPTTLNSQGPDFGTQYRSVILYHDDDQKKAAQAMYKKLTEARAFSDPIVTELVPFKTFYPAEKYHQDYFRRNMAAPYCQAEIVPKLQKLHLIK